MAAISMDTLIDFNGNVYVCCMTRERIPPLGNIRDQSCKEDLGRRGISSDPPKNASYRLPAGGATILWSKTRIFGKRLGRIEESTTPVVAFPKSGGFGIRY